MRVETILTATKFPKVNNPSYILTIDFGVLGIKKTSAQITELYTTKELIGKQIVAVLNFPNKQIASSRANV
jgi:tRNA-binding protein